ncbi:MAG: exodeoxyribonuclease III [Chitinophagales bacterium]|nr:exodeoxyribonuclease III [Chitinophagales bacterium]MBP9796509.1 exodeoxyribonuclease III [Chitinophagales bacterium]
MKIITYNLNGIRAAMNRGWLDWVREHAFDIICVQELKAEPGQLDVTLFDQMGYHHYWHPAQKKGYSGVAIFSKIKPDNVVIGCGNNDYDCEGRVIRADYGDKSVYSIYFPSGTTGDLRQGVKYKFLDYISTHLKEVQKERKKLIVCGDYNIAHTPLDIHDPKGNKNSSGFLPEERAWMDTFYGSGYVDSLRFFNKDPHQYTWWSYRANARANNKGWRIDYIAVTENLSKDLVGAKIYPDAMHSDHCPQVLEMKWS